MVRLRIISSDRVSTTSGNQGNQGKLKDIFPVREKSGKLANFQKIREKSGNFDQLIFLFYIFSCVFGLRPLKCIFGATFGFTIRFQILGVGAFRWQLFVRTHIW